jgi:hypothetical protein
MGDMGHDSLACGPRPRNADASCLEIALALQPSAGAFFAVTGGYLAQGRAFYALGGLEAERCACEIRLRAERKASRKRGLSKGARGVWDESAG